MSEAKATPVKAEDFERYVIESEGFERDWIAELRQSRTTAWRIAGVGVLIGVLGLLAGVAGLSQKPAPPLVLRVDQATGAVDVLGTMPVEVQSWDEQTDKYWVNDFMLCREGYDWNTIQACYEKIGLMAGPQVQADYAQLYNDMDGRHIRLSNRTRVIPHITSITLDMSNHIATVRFSSQFVHDNGSKEVPRRFIATLAYRYIYNAKLSEAQRRINLLGFQVISYRVDNEL